MAGTTDQSATDAVLICRLVVAPGRRVVFSRDQEEHYVDSLDAVVIPPLQLWDRARRAQGRPPTFEEFLEAYWIGFGCLRWLVGLSRFHVCAGCGKFITESELSTHAEHCAMATESHNSNVPDPPEEIYLCPDEECGFWSTNYPDIRAPHRSKAHGGTHSSQSFILEDDADVILDLWMRRYPSRVVEVRRCRICDGKLSLGRSLLDHFVKHHTTAYSGDDICGKLITGTDISEKKMLRDLICRTSRERGSRELVVVFSPSLQRVYREKIVSARRPVGAAGSVPGKENWVEKIVGVMDGYFDAHHPSRSTVDVSRFSNRFPAMRISPGRPATYSQVSSCSAMKIRVPALLRILSRTD